MAAWLILSPELDSVCSLCAYSLSHLLGCVQMILSAQDVPRDEYMHGWAEYRFSLLSGQAAESQPRKE